MNVLDLTVEELREKLQSTLRDYQNNKANRMQLAGLSVIFENELEKRTERSS